MHVSNELSRLLNVADKKAQKRGDQFISSELFVLAALESTGATGDALRAAGATPPALESAVDALRGGDAVTDAGAEDQRQALQRYTIDLTERAEAGKLDPVIGRDDEIRRVIQVLQRRTKNNPVLIGEAGVGKTPTARCPRASRTSACSRSTWPRSSQAPSSAASSRSASRPC